MNGVNLLVQLLEDGGESADHVEISLHSQPPEADFAAPSSDDVDELGRSRGSQMTSLPRTLARSTSAMAAGSAGEGAGSNTELRFGDVFKISACQSESPLNVKWH